MSNVSNSYGAGTTTLGSIGNWWSQATASGQSNTTTPPPTPAPAPTPAATLSLSNTASVINTNNGVIDLTGYSGSVQADFAISKSANTAFHDTGGLYRVDDASGSIDLTGTGTNILHPGDAGYTQAALSRTVVSYSNQDTSASATLQGGQMYASYIIANATVTDAFAHPTGGPNIYFGIQAANTGNTQRVQVSGNTLNYEDLTDFQYNDMSVAVNLTSVSATGTASTVGPNIVQNGNFEATNYNTNTTVLSGSSLANWQTTGTVAIKGTGYQGANSQELDLSGLNDAAGSGIKQTLNTVAGQTYRISFDVYTGEGSGLNSGAVSMSFGENNVAGALKGNDISDVNNGRKTYTFDVVATGTSTDLKFGWSGSGQIAQIDNVAVAAVIPASTPTPPAPPTSAPSNPPVDVSAFQPLASRTLDSLTLNGGTFTFQSPNEIVYVTGDVNINAATKFGGTGTIVSRGNINVNGDVQYADASSSLNVVGQQTTTFGSGATQVVGNFFDHNAAGTGTIVFNGPVQDTSGSFHADKFVYNGNANPTNVTSQTPATPSLSSNLPAPNGGNGSQVSGGNASASNGQANYSLYEQPQGTNAPKVIKPAQNGPMYLDPRGDFMKMFNEEVIQPLGQIIQSQANSKGRNGSSTTNAPSAYASFALSDSAKLAFSTADALTGMAQIKNGQVGAYVAPEPQAAPIFAPSATPKDNSDETKTDALPATTLAPPTSVAAQPVVQVAQVAASLVALLK